MSPLFQIICNYLSELEIPWHGTNLKESIPEAEALYVIYVGHGKGPRLQDTKDTCGVIKIFDDSLFLVDLTTDDIATSEISLADPQLKNALETWHAAIGTRSIGFWGIGK